MSEIKCSADRWSAVSPAASRQGVAIVNTIEILSRFADWQSATQQTGGLRYV